MKACVDQEKCINCGLCYAMASEVFELDMQTIKAKAKEGDHTPHKDLVDEAIVACPVDAISICEE